MDDTKQLVVTDPETEQQLQRMLRSKTFANRQVPAKLLEFLVQRAMRNESVTGKDILNALFPANRYEGETTAARTNASYMRGLVRKYYDTIGKNDLVIIQFPKPDAAGKRTANYRPTFSYRPDHRGQNAYLTGLHHLHQRHPLALERALHFFNEALKSQPNRVEVNIGMAEALVGLHMLQHPSSEDFGAAGEYAIKAVEDAPGNWHAFSALGAVYLVNQRDLEFAAISFEKAITLDSRATKRYGWYQAFLFATGQFNTALTFARSTADESLDDPIAHAIYAIWLYGLRRFEEAALRLAEAFRLDPDCRLALLCSALVELALGNPMRALRDIKAFQKPFEGARWSSGAVEHTCMRAVKLSQNPRLLITGADFPPDVERLRILGRPIDCREDQMNFSGVSLNDRLPDNEPDQEDLAPLFDTAPFPLPSGLKLDFHMPSFALSSALMSMTEQDIDYALSTLESAWAHGDPFGLWLHMMPIFDPLSGRERFQSLLRRRLDPIPTDDAPSNSV